VETVTMFLAAIGALWMAWYVMLPLADAVLYALGYTAFMWVSTQWKQWWKRPLTAAWFLFVRWPLRSFRDRLVSLGTTTHIHHGGWVWQP
jgi:hypothetical protein